MNTALVNYEIACEKVAKEFVKKYFVDEYEGSEPEVTIDDIDFSWVGDRVGEILVVQDEYFFNLSDIVYSLRRKVSPDLLFEWYDEMIADGVDDKPILNLENYIKKTMNQMNLHNIKVTFEELKNLIQKHLPENDKTKTALVLLGRSYTELEAQLHPGTVEPPKK